MKKDSKTVNDLSNELREEQSKISHALSLLRNCSIVQVKEQGRKRVYNLNKKTILPILRIIDRHKNQFCKKVKILK